MPDNVQHNTAPDSGAIAATDDRNPQSPLMDSHFDALLAKQRARDALHNDRLHHTTVSLPRSSSSCRTAPCSAITLRWRARQRDRQAFTNDLLRSAVTDLEDELILHIKKRCKLRNDAAKSSSDVLPEQLACSYDQPPSTPKGNMVVSLMDLVVTRRKGKLKSEVNGLIYSVVMTLIYRISSSIRRIRSSAKTQGQSHHIARLRRRRLSRLLGAFDA